MIKTFLLFVTVAMLPLYRSPGNCKSRHTEGNFTYKVNYCYCCQFPGLKFMQLTESVVGLTSQVLGDGRIIQIACFFG